jgi:hypothetical protein
VRRREPRALADLVVAVLSVRDRTQYGDVIDGIGDRLPEHQLGFFVQEPRALEHLVEQVLGQGPIVAEAFEIVGDATISSRSTSASPSSSGRSGSCRT